VDDDRPRATLPAAALAPFERVSLFNSPYDAHRGGRAVDLYPGREPGADPVAVATPVAGEVRAVRSVRAPARPYAEREDHLVVLALRDPGRYDLPAGSTARVLHVDSAVEAGDRLDRGEYLGRTVRSGFFAPWVSDHLHLGFRPPDADPVRASGSLPVAVDVPVHGIAWDGHGTVRERGDTYLVLDRPRHPAPGEFAGLAAGSGGESREAAVLDGGLPHYEGGGLVEPAPTEEATGARTGEATPVDLLGRRVGTAAGRRVIWGEPTVRVEGHPVTGLSLFLDRRRPGAKVVCPDLPATVGAVGDEVQVRVDGARRSRESSGD
jgi:hypothetical protein